MSADRPVQLHMVRVDVDPAHDAAFNRWYDEVHLPALLACPGWLSARRFVSLEGGPRYAAIYEIAGDWVYDTPEFHAAKGFMEFTPHVANFMRQRFASIGPVREREDDGDGAGGSLPASPRP